MNSRWSGCSEMWSKKDMSSIIVRDSETTAYKLDLVNNPQSQRWELLVFKKAWSFNYFNGSSHLKNMDIV